MSIITKIHNDCNKTKITQLNHLYGVPGIYLLSCTTNNKKYIGKSLDLGNRIICHKRKANNHKSKHPQIIDLAIRKHGWNNFEIEILELFDFDTYQKQELNDWLLEIEAFYIKKYNTLLENNKGYNICLYSNDITGYKHSTTSKRKISDSSRLRTASKETRKKISEANKGRRVSCHTKQLISEKLKGKSPSERTKKKISEKLSGERCYWFGKRHSQATKDKISTSMSGRNNPNFGVSLPEHHKLALINSRIKPVKEIDIKTGAIVYIWKSGAEAAKTLKISQGHISTACVNHKNQKSHGRRIVGGRKWQFASKEEYQIFHGKSLI